MLFEIFVYGTIILSNVKKDEATLGNKSCDLSSELIFRIEHLLFQMRLQGR